MLMVVISVCVDGGDFSSVGKAWTRGAHHLGMRLKFPGSKGGPGNNT